MQSWRGNLPGMTARDILCNAVERISIRPSLAFIQAMQSDSISVPITGQVHSTGVCYHERGDSWEALVFSPISNSRLVLALGSSETGAQKRKLMAAEPHIGPCHWAVDHSAAGMRLGIQPQVRPHLTTLDPLASFFHLEGVSVVGWSNLVCLVFRLPPHRPGPAC